MYYFSSVIPLDCCACLLIIIFQNSWVLISLLLQWSTAYGRCIHLSTSVTDRQLRPVLWTLNVFSLILLLPLFLSHFFSSSSSPWTSTFLLNVDTRTMHRITANTMLQHGPTQLFFMLSLKKVPQQEFKKKIVSLSVCLHIYSCIRLGKQVNILVPVLPPKSVLFSWAVRSLKSCWNRARTSTFRDTEWKYAFPRTL